MDVIGIDLSGPCNAADTAIAAFRANGRTLVLQERLLGADDAAIAALIARTRPEADLVVGLDAPLSYNDGGGDRPADRLLHARAVAAGLPFGTVMPPTLTRIAYLTLRGITVARIVATISGALVAMVKRHRCQERSVPNFDRKKPNPVRRQLCIHERTEGPRQRVFSEADLDRHFPEGGWADEDVGVGSGDR